ncbi:MAG TPA: rhodanese-like domain-containing protein [Frankiaceae bacterium]|nr:rhodanese-like domain-containing protein [Frankiaceae bacterium]
MRIRSHVLDTPAAEPSAAAEHFARRLAFEADCADVGSDIAAGITGFTVIDCRSPELYARSHVPGAVNIPHRRISVETIEELLPHDTLLVTYCNGPHCNASTRGALRLATLGRHVKEMPGGMAGWTVEGLPVETGPQPSTGATPAAVSSR